MNSKFLLYKTTFYILLFFFFFSSRRRHTRFDCDWSSDVCSSDLVRGSVRLYFLGGAVAPRGMTLAGGCMSNRILGSLAAAVLLLTSAASAQGEIGRASCRERV